MDLVNVHRAAQRITRCAAPDVLTVVPPIAVDPADQTGVFRKTCKCKRVGIGFIDCCAVGTGYAVFISLTFLGKAADRLPDAEADGLHRQILGIPEVEIPGNADRPGLRRPNAEDKSAAHRVTSKEPGCMMVFASGKGFQSVNNCFGQCCLLSFLSDASEFLWLNYTQCRRISQASIVIL